MSIEYTLIYRIVLVALFIFIVMFGLSKMTKTDFSTVFVGLTDILYKVIPLILLGVTTMFFMGKFLSYDKESSKNLIDISQCKLLEENNYNGIFSENTNKLDCNGVIKNVPISEYDKAINLPKKEG